MTYRAATLLLFLLSFLSLPALAGELPLPITSLTRLLTAEIGAEAAVRILARTSLATASREAELRVLLSEYCKKEVTASALLALTSVERKALAQRAVRILAPGETFEVLPVVAVPRGGYEANLGRLLNIHEQAYVDAGESVGLMKQLKPFIDGDVTVFVRYRDASDKLKQVIGKVKYSWAHFDDTQIEILAAGAENKFLLASRIEAITPPRGSGLSELRPVPIKALLSKPVQFVTTSMGGKPRTLEGILEDAVRTPDARVTHLKVFVFSAKQTYAIPMETISALEAL